MKRLMLIIGCVGVAMAGCVSRQAAVVVEERDGQLPGCTSLEAKHAHLKSVLGIDDAVLADTNRFVLGEGNYCQEFKLDKPFGGFDEARVYIDKMEDMRSRKPDGKPHRLRSVTVRRWLPDDATDKEAVSEWQSACDFVADMLDVESPKVELVDVEKWRKMAEAFLRIGLVRSCVTFYLADNQHIDVRLMEPIYIVRNGKAILVIPGYLEIDLMYNRSLCIGGGGRLKSGDEEKVEKEIAFGPDCGDKLAEALKSGVERRAKRAKRKAQSEQGWRRQSQVSGI